VSILTVCAVTNCLSGGASLRTNICTKFCHRINFLHLSFFGIECILIYQQQFSATIVAVLLNAVAVVCVITA